MKPLAQDFPPVQDASSPWRLSLHATASEVDAAAWDALLARQAHPTPFMRHAYLAALEDSGSATPDTGWLPVYFTLAQADQLDQPHQLGAACVLYVKTHSRGEYVFDWAWAQAYARHGLDYYPKAVLAVPFTPVPGARLLAQDEAARTALLQAVLQWSAHQGLSSLHLLFGAEDDLAAARRCGLMLRQTVQFHWCNVHPATGQPFADFEDFLASLSQDKRKKIRQERRRVRDAGVEFRALQGRAIGPDEWDFFYRCYERTYLEHGNAPYLSRDFFARMASDLPDHWLMFIAERGGQPIASSLIGVDPVRRVAYGRYWGALQRVDCLHFEACYYQPLAWCIEHGWLRFEGGAQGEHKMARALLPVATTSAHWLAHPAFADAVDRYLARETGQVQAYMAHLAQRSPLKTGVQNTAMAATYPPLDDPGGGEPS